MVRRLKRDCLGMMRETTLLIRHKRHLLRSLYFQFKQSHLHKLFIGFIQFRVSSLRVKSMIAISKQVENHNLLKKGVSAFKKALAISKFMSSRIEKYQVSLIGEAFQGLQYSSVKQMCIRESFYDFTVSKSR